VGSLIEAKREKYRRYAEKVKLLNGLPPEFVRQVVHSGQSLTYQQGGIVTREGSACTAMFIVIKGQISLYDRSVYLYKSVAGESFCELGVLLKDFKSPTAVADMETQLLGLEDHAVRKLLELGEGKKLLSNFLRVIAERSVINTERIIRLHQALREHDVEASDRISKHAFEVNVKPAAL
jgi:CRP-like cAMP-binding protein